MFYICDKFGFVSEFYKGCPNSSNDNVALNRLGVGINREVWF